MEWEKKDIININNNLKFRTMYIYLTFIVLYSIIAAKHNQLVIENKKGWHLAQWFRVALVGITLTYAMVTKPFDNISEFWNILFVFVNLYWIIFDITLNLFRKKKWYYVSKPSIAELESGIYSRVDFYLRSYSLYLKLAMLFFSGLILAFYV
jgi:membrane protein YdbS with pleckstrin-like domain